MKKRILTFILALAVILSLAASLSSCGDKVSTEDARTLVKGLVSESYALNVIYFGEGLKYLDEDIEENSLYAPVSPGEVYYKKSALIEKTRKVFSEDYASDIIETAFTGVKDATDTNAIFARYVVYDGDRLYVNRQIEGIEINKYDYSNIEIIRISSRFIQAKMNTLSGDEVSITLINEKNGWRLDSATY